ncbi:hypothetical protein GQ43DRAFT_479048 [Delitschia confertaspora ATCC 74209]|uniref:MINDY deubiquitinase domain-containing protein n=1 Tax=Delitschia confertaspora ATCC 74209 TaxID=1513339 RepID=A0A9P4JS73_9PLEO|nr:hypothetical protein GQ43DRAFT_479048 [Delitschia confertaspora ATCC 74209]
MVRKPVPHSDIVPAPLAQAVNNPPYPITPSSEKPPSISPPSQIDGLYSPDHDQSPAFRLKPLDNPWKQKEEPESDDSLSDWEKADAEDSEPEDIPEPLKLGNIKQHAPPTQDTLPDVLRAGPPLGVMIKKSLEKISPEPSGASAASYGAMSTSSNSSNPVQTNNPNNPYLKMQFTGQSSFGGESSTNVWGGMPSAAQKYGEIAELPATQTPITPPSGFPQFTSNSNISAQYSPFLSNQAPLIAVESPTPQSAHPKYSLSTLVASQTGAGVPSLDGLSGSKGMPADNDIQALQQLGQEQQPRGQGYSGRSVQESESTEKSAFAAHEPKHEDLILGDVAPQVTPLSSQPQSPDTTTPAISSVPSESPFHPPRPVDIATGPSTMLSEIDSPGMAIKKQKREYYQIKHIRWFDAKKPGIRTSPILTQNANGPCPLLALVNALVLSTPAEDETALIEVLRTREQVSLGLLLDAVFDELMSGRRGGAAQELPDVTELYAFLVTLHTGMNVNPMFVQDPGATDGPSTIAPSAFTRPGGFENTKEMRLYRTFNIPLIHGWLPEPGSEAYIAFERVAKTYDDAAHVQFQEEELNAKLQGEGLNTDEQTLFTNIIAIKEFLNHWPTQLTDFGLRTMQQSFQPGQIGILFRNDHFSTLYKHPNTGQILTLVTDAGYASHNEIVWESLVDVSGQDSELYSGDFRPVGNNTNSTMPANSQPIRSLLDIDDNQGWQTVQNRRRNQASSSSSTPTPASQGPASSPPDTSKTEQEDHDLALALQLQEEEEDRHRRSLEERRRRENQLSENAIASQGQGRPVLQNRPTPRPGQNPPRPGGNPPLIPPRRSNLPSHRPNNDPAPPPTYEEAASDQPYHPPQEQTNPTGQFRPPAGPAPASPYNPQLPPRPERFGRRNSRPLGMDQSGRPGRRPSAGVGPQEDRPDKCVVM